MNESFEDRVKNLFGSKLFETVPNNSFPTTSWSVADGEVERREWNREKGLSSREDEELPCSTSFYDNKGCLFKKKSRRDKAREFEGNLGEDDDDEEERESEEEREDDGDEEREIRDSVGMDPTLDNEDEEDEFDKAAFCKENNDERVYMSDINNHGSYINFHAVVPDSIEEPINKSRHFSKDPRADHFAASTRLNEDKTVDPKTNNSSDSNPKPILKRKEPQADQKPKKKVRFDPSFNDKEDSDIMLRNEDPKVPDYIRNPSKYTKYEFDLTEANDEEVNKRAFEDFCNLVRKSEVDEVPVELPKSVVFTPRKKNAGVVSMDESVGNNSNDVLGCSVALESDSCEMEEDDAEAEVNVNLSKKRGRQYRLSLKSMMSSEDGL